MGRKVALGELSPSNGTVHEFYLPQAKNSTLLSWGIVVDSAAGRVWFTDQFNNAVWSFEIHSRSFSMHALPSPLSGPFQLAQDRDRNIWFTEVDANKIGEIAASDGSLHEFNVPLGQKYNVNSASAGPAGIAIDGSGKIWFTEVYADAISSFSNGDFQEFNLNGEVHAPTGIALDQSGRVWLTEHGPSFIAEFDPQSHSLRSISTSLVGVKATLPYFVQIDGQGNVWFNEHYGNAIAKLVPSTGTLLEYRIPSKVASAGNISAALTLTLSPSGQPWFTELETGKIGTILTNEVSSLKISLSNSTPKENVFAVPVSGSVSLRLSVMNENETVTLTSSVGSATSNLSTSLVPDSGRGSFNSTLVVSEKRPRSSEVGTYLLTVSAVSRSVIVSQVIVLKT
jgi:virginiamycin B lyase